ncbi:unnamed protein product [Taenia asiatica]|uniref:UBA domain-containing protein n=1 Tax=Taenia asiatica TaxID=60517 RepID=A0A0R3WAJ1_TAEAS|nr:unnamed protein product [Taenia asiatica]
MSRNVLSGDNHWGFSMLLGVKFIFKDRVVVVPDVPFKFTDLQDFSRHHMYDFDLEREVLNGYEAAEHEEGQGNGECKVHTEDNAKRDQPFMQHTPQLTMIEPEKTTATSEEPALAKPQPLMDRSLVEDFEVQGPRDDPFVAAELGTINDLEELRDVLASMPMPNTPSIDAKQRHMFGSLKNINFPRLSTDEDASNHTPSSAPTSQPNLFSRSPVQSSEEPAKSYAEVDADFCVSQISGSVDSDLPPFQKSSSPVKFDIDDKNMATTSLPLSSYPNALHIPVSLNEEAKSNPPDSPTASEYVIVSHADDPPIVTRLVKMGFRRSKILALYRTGIGETMHICYCVMSIYLDDDTLVAQLCNWTELEERGFKEEVGKAAVIFSPDDFVKASKFATMVSELSEMGFPLDPVISAVQSSKMDKEEAVLRLLDLEKHSDATPSPSYASNNVGFPQGNVLDAMARQGGRKSKKKEKKPHLSSYLHARH